VQSALPAARNAHAEQYRLQQQIAVNEELAQKKLAQKSADIPLACLIVCVIVLVATHITAQA
jgi:hypothetical protein